MLNKTENWIQRKSVRLLNRSFSISRYTWLERFQNRAGWLEPISKLSGNAPGGPWGSHAAASMGPQLSRVVGIGGQAFQNPANHGGSLLH
jgi:hypothetical protein